MRKIIVTELITLDGVVEAPGGNETDHPQGGWQAEFRAPDSGQYKLDELSSAGALLLGKNTYEQFVESWSRSTGVFAELMNTLPKYVVSRSLKTVGWNNCHLLRDVAEDVAALKKTEGGDLLVYGSATLVKALLQHQLVDELRLLVCPVSIGGGQRLFDDNLERQPFKLKHSRAFEKGVLALEYLPIY